MFDLGDFALSLARVTRGVACAGTALESRTFAVNEKSFLFVSHKDLRLKLGKSIAEAKEMGLSVGVNGWIKIPAAYQPSASVMKKWIAESHALMASTQKTAKKAAKKAKAAKTDRASRAPRGR